MFLWHYCISDLKQKSSLLIAGLIVLAAILLIPNMPINQANASTCSSSAGSGLFHSPPKSSSSTSSGSGSCAAASGASGLNSRGSNSQTGGTSHCGSFRATTPQGFDHFQSGESVSCTA